MPNRPYTSSAAHSFRPNPTPSSTTATATQTLTSTPVLRLRATATPPSQTTRTPRIQWAEDVIDNEGLGRKSSKVCCIYHAPRQVGESSSDESSSSSDDSSSDEHDDSSDDDDGAARMAGNRRAKRKVKVGHDEHGRNEAAHVHAEGGGCEGHDHGEKKKEEGVRQRSGKKKRRSGNAYERMPKHSKGSGTTVVVERKG